MKEIHEFRWLGAYDVGMRTLDGAFSHPHDPPQQDPNTTPMPFKPNQPPFAAIPGSLRCAATSKQTGQQCRQIASPGMRVCKWHGGRSKHGRDYPAYHHGEASNRSASVPEIDPASAQHRWARSIRRRCLATSSALRRSISPGSGRQSLWLARRPRARSAASTSLPAQAPEQFTSNLPSEPSEPSDRLRAGVLAFWCAGRRRRGHTGIPAPAQSVTDCVCVGPVIHHGLPLHDLVLALPLQRIDAFTGNTARPANLVAGQPPIRISRGTAAAIYHLQGQSRRSKRGGL